MRGLTDGKDRVVSSLFIGGGTPTMLTSEELSGLLQVLRESFAFAEDAECTAEANPGTVDEKKLAALLRGGINRLSFGLQSADEKELAMLGRIHSYADFKESYEMAFKAGFQNCNVDLMAALPGQRAETFQRTLEEVVTLSPAPSHLSVYSLIIEEGTKFALGFDARGRKLPPLPDEESERMLDLKTQEILKKAGYEHYEFSNYAKPGKRCRHNIGYWTGAEYLGIGLGASSLFYDGPGIYTGMRFRNTDKLSRYLSGDFAKIKTEVVTEKAAMEEFFFLGLRMTDGVSEDEFYKRFRKSADAVYKDTLTRYIKEGFLERTNGKIRLTGKGIPVSNVILSDFLLD